MSQFNEIFNAFAKKKIMVIGDVMVDHYIIGAVERISPEAPHPIVDVNQRVSRLGGAANVALNLKALGAEVLLHSFIGKDDAGEELSKLLTEAGISPKGMVKDKGRRTTKKTRIVSRQQQLLRYDEEDSFPLSHENETYFTDHIFSKIDKEHPDVVVFQDYNKGVLSKVVINRVMEHCINKGIPTLVDPKFTNFFEYKGCTLFKPNKKEAEQGLGITINPDDPESLRGACKKIQKELNNHTTVLTLGSKGIYVYSNSKGELSPSLTKKVYDVSGAGDTVAAILTIGVALNLSLDFIAELANVAAEQVCSEMGVVPVDKKQLLYYAESWIEN